MLDKPCLPIVLVIDALELRRAGIVSLIEPWAQSMGLVTEAIAPEDLHSFSHSKDVRFVIFYIGGASLHDIHLQAAAREIHDLFADTPCAILSDRKEADEAVEAAALGKQAFLSTSMQPEIARQALTFILGGGTYFPREALLESAAGHVQPKGQPQATDHDGDGLTRRQAEVLERLRLGKSNKHIARDLNMQESTVKVHVRQIMRKLGAANRTQAALLASATLHGEKPTAESAIPLSGKQFGLSARGTQIGTLKAPALAFEFPIQAARPASN